MKKLTPGRTAVIGAVLLSALTLAGVFVHNYNAAPSGYVAVYPVLAMWAATLVALFVAPILIMIPRARFAGLAFAGAIVLLPCAFFLGIKTSEMAGFNRWQNAEVQQFGPAVPASLVVYYKLDASRTQIDEFERTSLFRLRSDQRGLEFKFGIRRFLRLHPSQAYGHAGFAVEMENSIQPQMRTALIDSISSSAIVFKVYRDIAPNRIADPVTSAQPGAKN